MIVHELTLLKEYKFPKFCPFDGAGLEYHGFERATENIVYELMRCPSCGRYYKIRKYKLLKEELEGDDESRYSH